MSAVDSLGLTLTTAALLVTVWLAAAAVRGARTSAAVAALVVLELGAVLQAVLDLTNLPAGDDRATHLGYLVTSVVLLPAVVGWAGEDRTRWGAACLAVGCAAFAVVVVRLRQTGA